MTKKINWHWDLGEATSVFLKTYGDDWGRERKERDHFVSSHEYVFENQAGDITYLKTETVGQDVLFIHGSPGNAMRWQQYLQNVPSGYSFYSIDRMGFGKRKNSKPDLEKDYELIRDFVQTLNNPIVVGHSLGGALAARLAADLNDIKAVVFVAASLNPDLERIIPLQRIGRWPPFSWLLTSSIRNSNEEMFQLQKFLKNTSVSLESVTCPVHVIHAKDDGLVPVETIDFVAHQFTHAESVITISPDKGGHAIPWTHDYLIFQALNKITAQVKDAA